MRGRGAKRIALRNYVPVKPLFWLTDKRHLLNVRFLCTCTLYSFQNQHTTFILHKWPNIIVCIFVNYFFCFKLLIHDFFIFCYQHKNKQVYSFNIVIFYHTKLSMLIFLVFCVVFSILFVLVLCLVYPMLPVSQDCPFFFASLVFSNVY